MKPLAIVAALTVCAISANANLVTNGDFETGTFAGWTKSGNPTLSDVVSNTITSNTTFVWRSGATGTPALISQQIATVAGGLYEFEFDVYNTSLSNTAIFQAYFNGIVVFSFVGQAHDWTHHTFNVLATGTSTEVKFSARNDPSFTRLDNVSVTSLSDTSVPEPATVTLTMAAFGLLGLMSSRLRAGK